jgi:hypothetical protein
MAVWKAQIKVGNYGTPFDVEVIAGSSTTAKEVINNIYSPNWIRNLQVISSDNNKRGVSTNIEFGSGAYWFVGFVFALYICVTYWYIVVPISILIGLLIWWCRD